MRFRMRLPLLITEREATMKSLTAVVLALAGMAFSTVAYADPGKDESGKYREHSGYERGSYEGRGTTDRHRYDDERKEKFRTADGCEVERKWKKGEYEEKVKCKRRDRD